MLPSSEQVAVAAYYRWERRHFAHGHHGRDWVVAEQELIFAAHYEVVARFRLDGVGSRQLGDEAERRCRFCERIEPDASFAEPRLAVSTLLGNHSLFSLEECDDCHAQYDESVGRDLDRFLEAIRLGGSEAPRPYIPIAAFKGLTWAALTLLPEREMEYFEDAVEWVSNPDHDLDSRSIDGMECILHRLSEPSPFSWAALARRSDDDAPYPYLLAFFATGHAVFQLPIPLCARDEELEGTWNIPRVASPFGVGRGPLDSDQAVIPLSSSRPRRATRLEFVGP